MLSNSFSRPHKQKQVVVISLKVKSFDSISRESGNINNAISIMKVIIVDNETINFSTSATLTIDHAHKWYRT